MAKIIECVPNFSEGRDKNVIDRIVKAIASAKVTVNGNEEGVKVLDVDPGEATNRTVVTFVGSPEAVLEAAFQGVKCSGEVIDMRHHHGAHPRSGACDVLPLVPVAETTLEECAELARGLAKRIYDELGIPCYCYEPAKAPDFGPKEYNETVAKSGAINVGARDFLVAVNYNLNTTSTRRAMAIAFDVREKGRKMREGGSLTGKVLKDENGKDRWQPGTLKGCKAIGWYIDEYGIAQVSMNITDIKTTPLHVAYEEVSRAAAARGLRVTGAEIVGLVPKRVLMDAGKFYLERQERSLGISEDEIMKIAVKSMSLDDLKPFNPHEKVIEYLMEDPEQMAIKERLIRMTLKGFAEETASESPAPGGGSISAYMGALGAALGTMVANLSAHKRGWDDRWKEFSDWAEKGHAVMRELVSLVDEDTAAFDKIMAAFGLPKGTDEEKAARSEAIEKATLYATQVPLRTMKASFKAFEITRAMAETGNPNSVSDAGVGALAARSAVLGAQLNVKINAASLSDKAKAAELVAEADEIAAKAVVEEKEILDIVNSKING